MAFLTRCRVASLMRGLLLMTRDTVDCETFASRAMSQLLGLRRHASRFFCPRSRPLGSCAMRPSFAVRVSTPCHQRVGAPGTEHTLQLVVRMHSSSAVDRRQVD